MTVSDVQPATAFEVREAIRAAAGVGPFFRLELPDNEERSGWRPASEWYQTGLYAEVAAAARELGTGESRVAASIVHLGLAARLWSVALGCGLLCGLVPDLRALVINTKHPPQLGLTRLAGWNAAAPDQLAGASVAVVGAQLTALEVGLSVRLADRLLRGNSASAMVGALSVLTAASPDLGGAATDVARALLMTDNLRDAGVLTDPRRLSFLRRSCCLYYRVPNGGLCGDCCLSSVPDMAAPRPETC